MGYRVFDQYSLLHFAVGVVAYFWSVSFLILIILNILFELIENTSVGMNLINTYFTRWPGGKIYPDNLLNKISDIIITSLGWLSAKYLDDLYK